MGIEPKTFEMVMAGPDRCERHLETRTRTYWYLWSRSTVAQAADWSRPQLVQEELAAVPHPDLLAPPAAVAAPVETNLPWNDSLVIARVISVQPARGVCTAVVDWHALGRHFNSRLASEAVPLVGHGTIALDHVGLREGRLAVFIGQNWVRLAFWCGFHGGRWWCCWSWERRKEQKYTIANSRSVY